MNDDLEIYRPYKAPGVDCPECLVDTGDSEHFVDCSIGQRLGCATRRRWPVMPSTNPPPEPGSTNPMPRYVVPKADRA